ncbi:imm11 family protein [Salmonella enterica]
MSNSVAEFYVMEYLPDDAGSPYFMDKEWAPDLPDYDIFTAPPAIGDFVDKYYLKASAIQLDGDFLVNDNLVSADFFYLCKEFSANIIHIPVDISLIKGGKPKKEYYLFFLLDYIEILDQKESQYVISHDIESGLPNTPAARGLDKNYYETIDLFVVKKKIKSNFFFCQELSKPVCSKAFKEKFEERGLKSIEFKIIDENFKYDAWTGW